MAAFAGGITVSLTGCLGYFQGPADVAEDFIVAIDEGNFEKANGLIHDEGRIQNAGDASELLNAGLEIDEALDAIPISVVSKNVSSKSNGTATVRVTIELDLLVTTIEPTIDFEMRTMENELPLIKDWRIWDVNLV